MKWVGKCIKAEMKELCQGKMSLEQVQVKVSASATASAAARVSVSQKCTQ